MEIPSELINQKRHDGKTVGIVGSAYTFLATGEQTGGKYALIEAFIPSGVGPPLHHHDNEDEIFFMLDGAITVTVDEQELHIQRGDFVQLPKGSVHTFRNVRQQPARMLILLSPAGLDKFFDKFGVPMEHKSDAPPLVTEEHKKDILTNASTFGVHFHLPDKSD